MLKNRIIALVLIIIASGIAYFSYGKHGGFPYRLGLDLSGGTHLVYSVNTSDVTGGEVDEAMRSLTNVVERRVNLFGVSEPLVQAEEGGPIGSKEHRLIVELPGVTDIEQAIALIGKTPTLEFRLPKERDSSLPAPVITTNEGLKGLFLPPELTGKYLKRAQLSFNQTTFEPIILLEWNKEGSELFAKITRENIGKPLAIFLDDELISSPTIRQEITGGNAEISGSFNIEEAKALVRDLNYGALPLPISLLSTQTIGATLGSDALSASVKAGFIAFAIVAAFLLLWYRAPGIVSILALAIYTALNLAIFKLVPVTLTSAGIAGFILSLGMAVDANILIFERMKEELRRGKNLAESISEGFRRAWLSIRDSNLSSIITATILFYFASTPVVKGFALVFFIGVIISMFSAITASRTLLLAIGVSGDSKFKKFIFGSGISPKKLKN